MIRLALTDLDDTLIAYGSSCASERAIAALHAVVAAGLHAGPVSGRIPAAMSWMFAGDTTCYETGAFVNGQIVRLDGQTIHVETIDSTLLERVACICDDIGDAVLVIFDPYIDDGGSFVTRKPHQLGTIMDALAGTIFSNPSWKERTLSGLKESSYVKANVRIGGGLERRTAIRDLLRTECPELSFVFPSASAPLIDISPMGWDKGSAVQVLIHALGISPEEVVTFGDSENDLSLMNATPHSVAVANASAEVIAAAQWHIGSCADDAVAIALEDIASAAALGNLPTFMRG